MEKSISKDTRAALINAAERLFAEKGVGTVSARDIARAAAARNESAVQYHFGSVDSLIRAVISDRARQIDEARLATLAELDAAGDGTNMLKLIEAAIAPVMRACDDENGLLVMLFLVQLTADPRFNIEEIVADAIPDSISILTDRIRTLLHHLPSETRDRRMRMMSIIGINIAADHARLLKHGRAPNIDQAIEEAVVSMSGFLQAKARM